MRKNDFIQTGSPQDLGKMTSERWEELANALFSNQVTKVRVDTKDRFLNP